MIVLPWSTHPQGSPEWLRARTAIPTASRFDRIMTPANGEYSKGATKYAVEILTERLHGRPLQDWSTPWAERGQQLEDEARAWYELEQDVDVERVGFILRDDRRAGCSPDGLVGDDGMIEIKCRSALEHMMAVLGHEPIAAATQVQGSLWITGREWCDVVAYCPGLPCVIRREVRDAEYIAKLAGHVARFLEHLDEEWQKIDRMLGGRAPWAATVER